MIFNYKKKLLWIFLIVLFSRSCWAQVDENIEVLNRQLIKPLILAVDSTVATGQAVIITSTMNDELNEWVINRLRDELLKKNTPIFDSDESILDTTASLNLQNIFVQIYYKPIAKNVFLQNSKYERHIESLLSFYIKEKDESIVYSYSKIYQMADTLLTDQLEQVESKFLPFTIGKRLETGWVRKFFEPALVTITTIGIIFLFYSLRSG